MKHRITTDEQLQQEGEVRMGSCQILPNTTRGQRKQFKDEKEQRNSCCLFRKKTIIQLRAYYKKIEEKRKNIKSHNPIPYFSKPV